MKDVVYFISYAWQRNEGWNIDEELTQQHPLFWLNRTRKEREKYRIINWVEVPFDIVAEAFADEDFAIEIDSNLQEKIENYLKEDDI